MIQGLDQKIIYSSFYEEMQAKNLEEEERRERKKREDHQKHERISKEEEKLILEEVAKTKDPQLSGSCNYAPTDCILEATEEDSRC